MQSLLTKNEKKLARFFIFTFRYIVMSFGVFVDPHLPYCVWKFEIKDTTATGRSASNIDLHLEIDSEGWLRTKLYDKRDDYNFPIVNFPFICSNIPAASPNGVLIAYISELVVPIRISLTEGYCIKCSFWLSWSNHFESFTVATITWLTVTEYLCHKRLRIWSTCHL